LLKAKAILTRLYNRLDRLLLLLSTGSTPVVRQTAAKQLGGIAAQCIARPSTSAAGASISNVYHGLDGEWSEVVNLLVKVLPFLRHKQWESRTAAALAVECIVKAAGVWEPPEFKDYADADTLDNPVTPVLRDFDIVKTILQGKQLLASSGNEYAGSAQSGLGKQELVKSLGLSVPGAGDDELGIDVDAELRDGALQQNSTDIKGKGKASASSGSGTPQSQQEDEDLSHLSARERNAMKRKRKAAGAISSNNVSSAPPAKSRKLDPGNTAASSSVSRGSTPSNTTTVKKEEATEDAANIVTVSYKGPKNGKAAVKDEDEEQVTWTPSPEEWPFKHFVSSLQEGLLNTAWEIRHGAALGIREILKVQGRSGGMMAGATRQQNHMQHQEWADHLAVDLLSVLALDRFGDFVGDQVMAPVRETASQTLSALMATMPKSSVLRVYDILSSMVRQDEVKTALDEQAKVDPESRKGKRNYFWEVKHAGLLGIKYLVAVRRDLFSQTEHASNGPSNGDLQVHTSQDSNQLVENILDVAILGLADRDDDVRSVAASVLLPISGLIVEHLPTDKLVLLLDMLYTSLGDLRDDLSSSVGNVMDLLSQLLQFPRILDLIQNSGDK
jgi:TATA-binding protein-associated factor